MRCAAMNDAAIMAGFCLVGVLNRLALIENYLIYSLHAKMRIRRASLRHIDEYASNHRNQKRDDGITAERV